MYLIAKQTGGYQAIPIKAGDKWDFHKLLVGHREIRIILRVRGRRYVLYHTRELTPKYPGIRREHLVPLCDEIIAVTSERISKGQKYITNYQRAGRPQYGRPAKCEQFLNYAKQLSQTGGLIRCSVIE